MTTAEYIVARTKALFKIYPDADLRSSAYANYRRVYDVGFEAGKAECAQLKEALKKALPLLKAYNEKP